MTALSDEIDAMISEHGGRVRDALNIAMAQRDALREELADVRAQWAADVGSAIARAQTAEADARRWQAEARRMADLTMGEHMRSLKQSAAARKVARYTAQATASMDAMEEQVKDARAEAARLRSVAEELAGVVTRVRDGIRNDINGGDNVLTIYLNIMLDKFAALRGPAQSEQPAARRQEANDDAT